MEKEIIMKISTLHNQLDNIGWELSDAKESLNKLENKLEKNDEKVIKDVDNLKRELKRDGLYSEKIEEFLENYMRYYNK